MTITQCNICQQVIQRGEETRLYLPKFSFYDLCKNCAQEYLKPLLLKLEEVWEKVEVLTN